VRARLSAGEQGTCVCFLIAAQIPSRPPIKLGARPAKLAQSVLSRTTKTLPSCTPVENQRAKERESEFLVGGQNFCTRPTSFSGRPSKQAWRSLLLAPFPSYHIPPRCVFFQAGPFSTVYTATLSSSRQPSKCLHSKLHSEKSAVYEQLLLFI
jgi:hypothetical protein